MCGRRPRPPACRYRATSWSAGFPSSLRSHLPRRPGDRPDLRSLAQQPGRELAPAVPTTGSGNGQFQGRKDPAEICFRPCLDPQPLQPRTPSQPPRNFQTGPGHRLGRVASTCSLRPFDCRFYKSCPVNLTMSSRTCARLNLAVWAATTSVLSPAPDLIPALTGWCRRWGLEPTLPSRSMIPDHARLPISPRRHHRRGDKELNTWFIVPPRPSRHRPNVRS